MAENTQKKPGFFARMFGGIAKFWRDFASEAKKVVWMSASDVRKNTLLVVTAAVAISVVIGLLDWGFSNAIQALGELV
jgi:preprotein translocase SecE subunit